MFKFILDRFKKKHIDHATEMAEFNKKYNPRPMSNDQTVYADISRLKAEVVNGTMLLNAGFRVGNLRKIMEVSNNCMK